jgi:hypothetical protein
MSVCITIPVGVCSILVRVPRISPSAFRLLHIALAKYHIGVSSSLGQHDVIILGTRRVCFLEDVLRPETKIAVD